MLSFAYPAQAHVNHRFLHQALKDFGPRKSILGFLEKNYDSLPAAERGGLNCIVNNWHDVQFNCQILIDPLESEAVVQSPLYECVGHSLRMGLSHTLWLLHSSFDRDAKFLPDPRKWDEGFADLRNRKVPGYFYGGKTEVVPLGARSIFEGQARFSEVQFLFLASGRKLLWRDFDQLGMFGDVYMRAFDRFLEWGKVEWPDTPIHSSVQLFLLICDLAINPSDGYPFDLLDFQSFIISNDPSFRFYWFCRQVANYPTLKTAIKKCSRREYREVSSFLCQKIICQTPDRSAKKIAEWAESKESLVRLMKEEELHVYVAENLPVRVCFAKHIRLMQDKARTPEFFCWPGMHVVEHNIFEVDLSRSQELFERHKPLFIADLDGEIRPASLEGKSAKAIQGTFDDFYRWNILYDLTGQWIVHDGPFNYNFSWLTKSTQADVVKRFADSAFIESFGISPDSFVLKT